MVLGAETGAFSEHFLRADWELLNASLCFLKENYNNEIIVMVIQDIESDR